MIYLLRKHDIPRCARYDIISVPSYAAGAYHPFRVERISLQKSDAFASLFCMERDMGVEPTSEPWEGPVLPMY